MIEPIFKIFEHIDRCFWAYIAFVLIMSCGLFLTISSGFFQIRYFPKICKTFFHFLDAKSIGKKGVHPLKAFFASTGGMIGIGNLVAVATAIQIGGPGALFWVWVAGIIGAILKYSEIYLGFKFRVENKEGGYDGGPLYYLQKAFGIKLIPIVVAVLLCIYGVEIYQFSIITESISTNWHMDRLWVVLVLLACVVYAVLGGVKRIGQICSWVMPVFLLTYLGMGIWVLIQEASSFGSIFFDVFRSAFTGHAAVGGFAGSTVVLAIQHGISRAAYSADIGIGYDSIIQSESSAVVPERQARLAILGVALDNLICTFSILIVLMSGVWKLDISHEGSQLIQLALAQYFPYTEYFIPLFLIVTGYTTIIAFFAVGMKCARYLSARYGKKLYFCYGIMAFLFFSYAPQTHALVVMSISGALLLMFNLVGIFRLRHEISFLETEPFSPLIKPITTH